MNSITVVQITNIAPIGKTVFGMYRQHQLTLADGQQVITKDATWTFRRLPPNLRRRVPRNKGAEAVDTAEWNIGLSGQTVYKIGTFRIPGYSEWVEADANELDFGCEKKIPAEEIEIVVS